MFTISDYLNQLDEDKDTLYNGLLANDIEATQSETFTTLAPKVENISTKIATEFKPIINITGVNITDEPLTEYPEKLNEGLINVLNNGTDIIIDNYPNKETKEGSSQIFNNTIEAKVKIKEKGYLLQYGSIPSPTNEVPIYTTTGDNYIEISNVDTPSQRVDFFLNLGVKNLWNPNKLIPGFLKGYGEYPTNNTAWPNAKYYLIPLKANQTLYIKNGIDVNAVGVLRCIDKDTNEIVTYIGTQQNSYFTASKDYSAGLGGNGTITAKVDFIVGLMIKDPRYEVSCDISINDQYISDNPIELCQIPNTDYQDYIYKTNNGAWYLHKEIGKIVLNGNSALNTNVGELTNVYIFQYPTTDFANITSTGSGYCNILNSITWSYNTDTESYYLASDTFVFKINKTLIDGQTGDTTLDKCKTYLNKTNLILYGALKNPTDTPITDYNIINQLEQIYLQAKSYTGRTQITAGIIGDSAPMILETTVLKEVE